MRMGEPTIFHLSFDGGAQLRRAIIAFIFPHITASMYAGLMIAVDAVSATKKDKRSRYYIAKRAMLDRDAETRQMLFKPEKKRDDAMREAATPDSLMLGQS